MDQVPPPFVVDQDITYEAKGSNSVWISQPENGLDKRQCTLQICIRPTDDQPVKPVVFFSGEKVTFQHKSTILMTRELIYIGREVDGWMEKLPKSD